MRRRRVQQNGCGLLPANEALLEAHGWELAFWAVMDEGEIEDCVTIIGHRAFSVPRGARSSTS